jgi:hypothetical protein
VPPKISHDTSCKRIAICIVIVDKLLHENVWKEWSQTVMNNNGNFYYGEIFIHAKYPEKIISPWVRSKLIDRNFFPEWNSTEVVRAMLQVLSSALDHSIAQRFVFATESCLPMYSLSEMCDLLYADERSWLNAWNVPRSSWEAGRCFGAVDTTIIPREAIWKSLPGWIMLTRHHASEIVALVKKTGGWDLPTTKFTTDTTSSNYDNIHSVDLVGAFGPPGQWHEDSGGVFAPEEVFFPTMLGILGYLKSGYESGLEVKKLSISYATWAKPSDANPRYIERLNEHTLHHIRASGALMARKFRESIEIHTAWLHLVKGDGSSLTNIGIAEISTGNHEKDTHESTEPDALQEDGKRVPEDVNSEESNHPSTIDLAEGEEVVEVTISTQRQNEDEHIHKRAKFN